MDTRTDALIRPFSAEDAPAIARLHKSFSQWFEEQEITQEYVLSCSLRHDFRFYTAVVDGRLAGFTGVLFYESVGRAEIGPICVDAAFQGRGIGSRLLSEVLEFLRERPIHRVTAKVKAENARVISFFERNGFEREAVLQKYTRMGEPAVQMVLFP
ncbi:MAG: GNAT family N-acetyltransferase [Candidatus Altiarchaeota archaeon]|nr:GNAT family N-acetyltransferase [Candidatus Altiarchaeota archaeon]